MVDAHIHLQSIPKERRTELLSHLCDLKFSALFCNATSPDDWSTVMSIADFVESVKPFIGVHPWFVDHLPQDWEALLVHNFRHSHCGIGEIGLDRTPKGGDFDRQKSVFVRQLDLALMFKKPFSIHCVEAWGAMMTILRSYNFNFPFIVHSFIGSGEILHELINMGAMISVGQRSLKQHDAVSRIKDIPDDRLLIETDFPYLPKKNKDEAGIEDYRMAIMEAYKSVGEIRSLPVEQLIEQVKSNARMILKFI
ncbi:MAG: TatD family hydrolase [Candidatus Omnitrophota bacterium]